MSAIGDIQLKLFGYTSDEMYADFSIISAEYVTNLSNLVLTYGQISSYDAGGVLVKSSLIGDSTTSVTITQLPNDLRYPGLIGSSAQEVALVNTNSNVIIPDTPGEDYPYLITATNAFSQTSGKVYLYNLLTDSGYFTDTRNVGSIRTFNSNNSAIKIITEPYTDRINYNILITSSLRNNTESVFVPIHASYMMNDLEYLSSNKSVNA